MIFAIINALDVIVKGKPGKIQDSVELKVKHCTGITEVTGSNPVEA